MEKLAADGHETLKADIREATARRPAARMRDEEVEHPQRLELGFQVPVGQNAAAG
jgi:hypothetical protein